LRRTVSLPTVRHSSDGPSVAAGRRRPSPGARGSANFRPLSDLIAPRGRRADTGTARAFPLAAEAR